MKTLSILLLITCFTTIVKAQDTTNNKGFLKPNQIYMGNNGTYLRNNQKLPVCDLGSLLVQNSDAFKEYTKYKSSNKVSNFWMPVYILLTASAIVTINSEHNLSGKLFLSSFIPMIWGIHSGKKATRHFNKAIEIYNNQY